MIKNSIKMDKDLRISAISAVIAEILTLPICTIKSNYQNNNSNSIIKTIKEINSRNGIKSFYSSSLPAISSQVTSISLRYTFYRELTKKYGNENYKKPIFGFISAISTTIITHPMDFYKINIQMNNDLKDSFKVIYRGYSKTLLKATISGTLFLPMYEYLSEKFGSKLYGSIITSVISTLLMHPLDYKKTLQIYGSKHKITMLDLFTKGLHINLLRVVPHFTIFMISIDLLNKYFYL